MATMGTVNGQPHRLAGARGLEGSDLEMVLESCNAFYNGVQEGFGSVASFHVITLRDTGDTIGVPLTSTLDEVAMLISAKRESR